jgi:hypothetical protein
MKVTFTPLYSGTFTPSAVLVISSNSEPKNLYGRFFSLQHALRALKKFLDNPSYGLSYGPGTGLAENTLFLGLRGAITGTSVSIEIKVSDSLLLSFSLAEEDLPMEVFGIPRAGTSLTLDELITTLEERISPQ